MRERITFNSIRTINPNEGDYIVLVDYGSEGISIFSQCKTISQAVYETSGISYPSAIVKLVVVDATEVEEP